MKIRYWPSKAGATVTSGSLVIEVWEHGGCTRLVRDNSQCGYSGTHYTKLPHPNRANFALLAIQAVESWKNDRNSWKECE